MNIYQSTLSARYPYFQRSPKTIQLIKKPPNSSSQNIKQPKFRGKVAFGKTVALNEDSDFSAFAITIKPQDKVFINLKEGTIDLPAEYKSNKYNSLNEQVLIFLKKNI